MFSKCPSCKHQLEEIMIDVMVASVIVSISECGDITYGDQTNDGGTVDRYQCMQCEYVIPSITDPIELYDFMNNNHAQ